MNTFLVKGKKDGGIEFKSDYQHALFKECLKGLIGKNFALHIDQRKPKRSEAQNRFYWLYIESISHETGYTKEELHDLFKGMFLTRKIKEVMGKKVRITKSTTLLTKSEFSEYVLEIQNFTGILPPDTEEFFYGNK